MISVYDFYKENKDSFKLSIKAGEEGLKKPALWLYMAEDKSAFDFIRGGELTVTTGMAVSGSKELYEFIRRLIKHNASGLIINTGRYIKESDITEETAALCSSAGFALFTMPWEMHLSDLMQSFANLHFKSRQREENMKILLPALCRNLESVDNHKDFLISQGLTPEESYTIGLCDIAEEDANKLYLPDIITVYDTDALILLFFGSKSAEAIERAVNSIQTLVPKAHIGVGSTNKGYENFAKSYVLAVRALKIAEYANIPLFSYEKGGIYTLLMNTEPAAAMEYAQKKLGSLTDEELLSTLEAYICCRGSLKAAAVQLNCHRNTVLYRIEKIRKITGCNIDDGAVLNEMYCAIAAFKYAKSRKN